jgi:ABC-type molybdenum transport system ATPase subunit/photorepair protein PhrA
MFEIGKNIYANFTFIQKKVSEKVRAVVMGHCGSGKTSLFNNLCNTHYEVGSAK